MIALPADFRAAHELCFMNHDVMLHLLHAGIREGSFQTKITFPDDESPPSFESGEDIFAWLDKTNRVQERAAILRCTVFPSVLSDFLHFVFEALKCSQKGKLIVAFALLRKPLQDSLGLLETIAVDLHGFTSKLQSHPADLDAKKSGPEAHSARIATALAAIGETERFDPEYLSKLRYDKGAEDTFAASCDKALHLFTGNKAVATEPLNINFIFSDSESWFTQWSFIYSRLPYVLCYARLLVEHVFGSIDSRTDPEYLKDMERRISAATVMWSEGIAPKYRCTAINRFVHRTQSRLNDECRTQGFRGPTRADLGRMRDSGAFPGERWINVQKRSLRYSASILMSDVLRRLR